jgi:hypothetical protein
VKQVVPAIERLTNAMKQIGKVPDNKATVSLDSGTHRINIFTVVALNEGQALCKKQNGFKHSARSYFLASFQSRCGVKADDVLAQTLTVSGKICPKRSRVCECFQSPDFVSIAP